MLCGILGIEYNRFINFKHNFMDEELRLSSIEQNKKVYGETHEEIMGFVKTMNDKATQIETNFASLNATEKDLTNQGHEDFEVYRSRLTQMLQEGADLYDDPTAEKAAIHPLGKQARERLNNLLELVGAKLMQIDHQEKNPE